ncbi:MAG: hypothetical protein EpisKO_41200 [Epibacterium sp.]
MTQIDITTPAIISRCEHIEHCALGGSHKDAQRMRGLAEERDTLAKQTEDTARVCAEQAEEIRALRGQLTEARNAALDEAAEVVAHIKKPTIPPMFMGQTRAEAYDIGQHNACESKAELIRALKAKPTPRQIVQEALPPIASAEFLEQCKQALLDNYRFAMGVTLTAHHIPTEQFVATKKPTVQEAAQMLLSEYLEHGDGLLGALVCYDISWDETGVEMLPDIDGGWVRFTDVEASLRSLAQAGQANG